MKKALSIFLALTLLLSSVAFVYAKDTATAISTAEEFAGITADGNYILTADITLSAGFAGTFTGTFDGNNHIITIGTATAPATQGVFSKLGEGAVIKNLIVDGNILSTTHAGAIAGELVAGTSAEVINCVNFADVKSTTAGKRIGGIIGSAYGTNTRAVLTGCVNYGIVNMSAGSNSAAGGMIGISTDSALTNCVNYADITCHYHAGGMIGWVYGSATITGCSNFAKISANNSRKAGGIIGTMNTTASGTITNCSNGGTALSGIVGSAVNAEIGNCINTGTVTNAITDVETTGNYYLKDSATVANGATEKTAEELAAIEGFSVQSGYGYPIPSGITYKTEETFKTATISTAEEFQAMHKNWNYTLTGNIDLNTVNYTSVSGFCGTLDGAGYTVTIGTKDNPASQGLFATIDNGAHIKNITVAGCIVSNAHVGAVAGETVANANSVVAFTNCINLADVTAKANNKRVAGIIGSPYNIKSVTFENCVNYGDIKLDSAQSSANTSAGGIAALATAPTAINCANYGNVSSTNKSGGIIGFVYGGTFKAEGCANFGNISSNTAANAGGIIGAVNTAASGSVTDSFNGGNAQAGFIAVLDDATVSNSINTGVVTDAIAIGATEETDNYCLNGSSENYNGAVVKTKEALQTEGEITGFVKAENYDYILPAGITYKTKDDITTIVINSAEEFSSKLAANPSGKFKLNADIILKDGYNGTFSGTFDGNNHKITVGTADAPASYSIFAKLENGAVIKNLVADGVISSSTNAGGIAGEVAANAVVTISDCVNFADISTNTTHMRSGGIVGSSYGAGTVTFNNCINYGNITSTGNGNSAAGGILGMGTAAVMNNCVNYGAIYGAYRAAGIIGWIYSSVTIDGCANFGTMSSPNNGTNTFNDKHGGIVGYAQATVTGEIKNSYNGGKTYAGIVKQSASALSITNCVNTGVVTNAIADVETTGNYYLKDSATTANGATVKTSAELQTITPEGFKKQDDYLYPIPSGINYVSEKELNPVAISKATEFAEKINEDLSGSYILAADIDLGSIEYTAIENFSGVLNGAGYTVKLGENATSGIFASVNGGVVKNLSVTGKIEAYKTSGAVANEVPANGTGTFINCKNYADITVKVVLDSGDSVRAGGIVGSTYEATSAEFTNCINYAAIKAEETTQASGAIVGISSNTNIENCVNYGEITCATRAGGIIGWSYGAKLIYCTNYGTVYANNAGGIIGATGNRAKTYVTSCANGGNVTVRNTETQVGSGIIGVCSLYIGNEIIEIADCINAGKVSNAAITNIEDATVGADVAVTADNFKVTGCYYLAGNGEDTTNSTAKTAEELKALNVDGFKAVDGVYNLEYPIPLTAPAVETNTLMITASLGGTVSPAGSIKVIYNQPVEITVTPDAEYYMSDAAFNTLTTLAEKDGIVITPAITDDALVEIYFKKISDVDLSDSAKILSTFTSKEEKFVLLGRIFNEGSIIICGKADKVKPIDLVECGIIIDITSEMGDEEFVLNSVGTRTLKADDGKITSDGKYGILIHNNDFICGERKIRAYAKYSNGAVDYSDIMTIEFEMIGVE